MFSRTMLGRWFRVDFAEQCEHNCFLAGRCQAVKGHKGYHWSYSPNGDYNYNHNDDDPQEDAEINAAGHIPPGARGYIQPGKNENYHRNFTKSSEITDKDELARLERGEFNDNESYDRPVMPGDDFYEESLKWLDEYEEKRRKIRSKWSIWKKIKYFFC